MEPDAEALQRTASHTPAHVSGKGRRFACVRCRQSKIRCENEQSGHPCRRCAALGYLCDYDADYKRVSKKRKIQELVNEVQHLRATVEAASDSGPSPTGAPVQSADGVGVDSAQRHYDPALHPPHAANEPLSSPIHPPSSSTMPPTWGQDNYTAPLDRTLGNVAVSGVESTRLFAKFFEKAHPFIDLEDETSSPDRTYVQSPLLFWAIIAVASRHDSLNSTLQVTLAPAVTELLWMTFARPPHSAADIRGMLLLCLWPFPAPSMSSECRFSLVAATRSAAMQVGLHCLDNMRDFSHLKQKVTQTDRLKAAKTWAACVVAVESVTGFIGQPSVVRDEVLAIAPGDHLPAQLDHLYLIFGFCNRIHRIMASVNRETGDVVHGERAVILTVLERDFKTLWTTLDSQMSARARMILAFVGLQMRVYYFFDRSTSPRRRLGIVRAYQLALLLGGQVKEVDGSTGLLRYAPVVYQDAIIFASIFLIKVMKSSYAEDVDVVAGNAALDVCLAKLRECVFTTGDFRMKLAKMLSQLRTMDHASRDAGDSQPHLKLRTRLSGSLVHDFLWMWREEFGGQTSVDGSPTRQPETSAETREYNNSTHGASAKDDCRQVQQQYKDNDHAGPSLDYPTPQNHTGNSNECTETNEDILFAEIFGGGGLDASSFEYRRADVDWFYQADSLAL